MTAHLAFFGLGKRALRERAELLSRVDHVRMVCGCDPRELARTAFGVFDDRMKLFDTPAPVWEQQWDAAIICAPAHLRAQMALQAVESGRHALLTLPVALNISQLETLRQACAVAREKHLALWPAQSLFFDPFWQALHARLASKSAAEQLGRIARFGQSVWIAPNHPARQERGSLAAIAHGIDSLSFLFPDAESDARSGVSLSEPSLRARAHSNPESHWTADGSLAHGLQFSFFAGLDAPPPTAEELQRLMIASPAATTPGELPPPLTPPWKETLRFEGSRGQWTAWPQQGALLWDGETPGFSQPLPPSNPAQAQMNLLKAFCSAVRMPSPRQNEFMLTALERSATVALELRGLGAAEWPSASLEWLAAA